MQTAFDEYMVAFTAIDKEGREINCYTSFDLHEGEDADTLEALCKEFCKEDLLEFKSLFNYQFYRHCERVCESGVLCCDCEYGEECEYSDGDCVSLNEEIRYTPTIME